MPVAYLRIYVYASVVGGCEDEEFAEANKTLFSMAKRGMVTLLLSDVLEAELEEAKEPVRQWLVEIHHAQSEIVLTTNEALRLQEAYLVAHVVGPSSAVDALHVALATIYRADAVASWNFKHLVNLQKIRRFSTVNEANGHPPIDIRSPEELIYGIETENV